MISGKITDGLLLLCTDHKLRDLYLNGNRLTGFIPIYLSDVGSGEGGTPMRQLYLADNDWWCDENCNEGNCPFDQCYCEE